VNDVGYNAHEDSPIIGKTPFIDALAAESVRLKRYYSHPTCTPSRAALLTGKYAHKLGLPFPLIGKEKKEEEETWWWRKRRRKKERRGMMTSE